MSKIIKENIKIIIILLIALGLRLIGINQSFWLDEATSGMVARDMNWSQIFAFIKGDFHPPLYYLLLDIWGKVFGYGEIALRMLSVLFATGTIYLIYLIAKKTLNTKLETRNLFGFRISDFGFAEVAALLLATSGLHLYYSQEARMYAMSAFLVTWIIYLFLKLLNNTGRGVWILFSVLLAVNFLTDYLPSLIIPAMWLVALLKHKGVNWWKKFVLAHVPLLIVIMLWLPVLLIQLKSGMAVSHLMPGWWVVLGGATLKNLALLAVKFSLGRISFQDPLVYAGIVGGVLLLEGWILARTVKKNWDWWLLFLTPIILAFLLAFQVHVFSYFRLLFVLPLFYLLLAKGAGKWWLLLVVLNLLLATYYLLLPQFHREDWRGLVSTLEADQSKFAFVLPTPNQREALYYYKPEFRLYYSPLKDNSFEKVYLMRYVWELVDSQDLARQEIESLGYNKIRELNFNGVVVWEYMR